VIERPLTDRQSVDGLVRSLAGPPASEAMPMWEDGSGSLNHRVANISFAVRIPWKQAHFEGSLLLTATHQGGGRPKTVRLPLRVGAFERAADLFVFFIATASGEEPLRQDYCWTKIPTALWLGATHGSAGGPMVPVVGADVDAKILRDNEDNGYGRRNRRVRLRTDSAGLAAFQHASGDRNVVAFPIDWPLIFTATFPDHLRRAHLARLASGDVRHNQAPHELSEIHMIPVATARALLPPKRVLIDPGHAVAYDQPGQARSSEWFVAHRIGLQVRDILHDRFAMPLNNLFMTRTAGIGLIAPNDRDGDAPRNGATRFVLDPAGRRLRVQNAALGLGLHELSDLVLTGDDDRPANVAPADRDRLIHTNAATVAAIVARIRLPAGQRVQPNSVRWDAATRRYVCRIEQNPSVPGLNPIIDDARAVPTLRTTDWFTLDAPMLGNLVDRTSRWSLLREISVRPGADAATGRPAFPDAARATMSANQAGLYMRQWIMAELALEGPYQPREPRQSMGWSVTRRRQYINRQNCDVAVSIHANADDNLVSAIGTAILVGLSPLPDQVRAAKLFMKYADPLDQGYRKGGVVTNVASLVNNLNDLGRYVYYELDYQTSTVQDNPDVRVGNTARYQYEDMVNPAFIADAAEQIVAGIAEFLLDRQSDIDTVTYNGPVW
jgi:N-acetylmuramoyl-L-alanine amidase